MPFIKNDKNINKKGRPVGSKNITTFEIKQAFLDVFEKLGGTEALFEWVLDSKHNKREFFKMLLALLPKETKLEHSGVINLFETLNIYDKETADVIREVNNRLSQNVRC